MFPHGVRLKHSNKTFEQYQIQKASCPHFFPKYKSVCVRIGERICLIKVHSTKSILSVMKSKRLCQTYLKGYGGTESHFMKQCEE